MDFNHSVERGGQQPGFGQSKTVRVRRRGRGVLQFDDVGRPRHDGVRRRTQRVDEQLRHDPDVGRRRRT